MPDYPVYNSILARRTIRKFSQKPVSKEILSKLVNAARLAPSGGNRQPLDYMVIDDAALGVELFKHVRWAGYIAPKGAPKSGEMPAAYIIVLDDKPVKSTTVAYDVGAAVQNIMLAAWEENIGCCWMGAIDRAKIREFFRIPMDFEIDSVVSLGYKAEAPVVEEYKGSVKYWLDEEGVLHVPKLKLEDVVRWNKF